MFAFNAKAMEAFGACGENLADVLNVEDIARIDDWHGYVVIKEEYVRGLES
jgi:hypothetical protein